MNIHRLIVVEILAVGFSGCVELPQPLQHADKSLGARQQDIAECRALAAQAAEGTGGHLSDPAIRDTFFIKAHDQYLALCLQSRGWTKGYRPPLLSW
jgi:hypothetical protein